MSETRKLAAILVADVVGYSRLAGADEDRTLALLRGCAAISSIRRSPPIMAASSSERATGVDAVRCAIEIQSGLVERNAGVPAEKRLAHPGHPRARRRFSQTKAPNLATSGGPKNNP